MKAFGEGQVASQALLGPVSPITSQGADFIYSYLQLFKPVPVLLKFSHRLAYLGLVRCQHTTCPMQCGL